MLSALSLFYRSSTAILYRLYVLSFAIIEVSAPFMNALDFLLIFGLSNPIINNLMASTRGPRSFELFMSAYVYLRM